MQFRLLAERRFGPLLAVQLLAALNDQAFMQALMVVLAYRTASFTVLARIRYSTSRRDSSPFRCSCSRRRPAR